ncbi:MAG TPA: ABC transporter permease [Candidatus Limnocylindrales bacterium]|jgi:peptide/nickel transport system permease protein
MARAFGVLRRDPAFLVGGGFVLALLIVTVLTPLIAPYDPLEQFRDALPLTGDPAGPSDRFLLGTDRSGRDYLSRLLYGARTSLLIGIGANAIASIFGSAVAAAAALIRSPRVGLPRGRSLRLPVENVLMRLTDLWLSFPVLLLTIAMAFVFGASVALVTIIIGTTLWTATARIVYGRLLVLRDAEFVEASRAIGTPGHRIFSHHLVPHVLPILAVYASLGIAATVLFEATLSYLGAGVPPPTPTWGTMLADHITWFATDPRLVILPGACITATVLAFNLLGDALRDALDPRSR